MPTAKSTSFKTLTSFFVFALFLMTPQVSATYSGVKITTKVVPGSNDFFIGISAYDVYATLENLTFVCFNEDYFPEESYLFYITRNDSYLIWRGDISSKFHEAFYSNGSWYILLQGGYPLLRIDGKPFVRVYPYNSTYNSITIYMLADGCIKPTWRIPMSHTGTLGFAHIENSSIVFSSPVGSSEGGFIVKVPLTSFERYFVVANTSAFVDSLSAVALPSGNVVIFFPVLYYFNVNGVTYAGIVKGGGFIPVFKAKNAIDYIFLFNDSLTSISTVRVNFDSGKVYPEIYNSYNVHDCWDNTYQMRSFEKDHTSKTRVPEIKWKTLVPIKIKNRFRCL